MWLVAGEANGGVDGRESWWECGMEELSRMGTEPWLGKGVSNGGSQHDGMAGRPLPVWVTLCRVKYRTNPMTNSRIKMVTLAMIHVV